MDPNDFHAFKTSLVSSLEGAIESCEDIWVSTTCPSFQRVLEATKAAEAEEAAEAAEAEAAEAEEAAEEDSEDSEAETQEYTQ